MIQLYCHPSPNPVKIALYLEEINTPYEIVAVDTRKGDQHTPALVERRWRQSPPASRSRP